MTRLPRYGEVWWCETPDLPRRPVVVLSRDVAIGRLRRVVVAPCSTNERGILTEVLLTPAEDPVPQVCCVHLDSILNVSVGELTDRLGALSAERSRHVCAALNIAMNCI